MLLSLAFMLCTIQGPDKPLLDQIGIKPTGRNGYEEFLQAGDVLAKGMFDDLWRADQDLMYGEKIFNSRGSELAKQIFAGKNALERRSLLVDRFAEATRLLELAAAKPIFDPRQEYDVTTLFPQLRWIRFSAHHLVNVAYVQRSNGDDRASVETLMRGMLILDSIQRGPLLCWFMGNVSKAFLLEELAAALPELSLAAAKVLEQQAHALEDRAPSIEASLEAEYRFIEGSMNHLFGQYGNDVLEYFFDEEDKFLERFRALDELGKREVVNVASRQIRDIRRQREAWIAEGPKGWFSPPDPLPQPVGTPTSEMANELAEAMLAEMTSIMPTAAIELVQLRLLHVTGAVIRYRWEHRQLPAKLTDALPETGTMCPLSQRPLVLSRLANGQFEIKSVGVPQTGEITLRSRPRRSGNGPRDP